MGRLCDNGPPDSLENRRLEDGVLPDNREGLLRPENTEELEAAEKSGRREAMDELRCPIGADEGPAEDDDEEEAEEEAKTGLEAAK